MPRPRIIIYVVLVLLSFILLYHIRPSTLPTSYNYFTSQFSEKQSTNRVYIPTHTRHSASCPPSAWSNGSWAQKVQPGLNKVEKWQDILSPDYTGFERCASVQRPEWHLGGFSDRPDRFQPDWNLFGWEWQHGCENRAEDTRLNPEDFLKDLIEYGGWLIIGDSLSEGHFFSLSCTLGPHVIATPVTDVGEHTPLPQQLFLAPDSPLLHSLRLPRDFAVGQGGTPLVTFLRNDFLLRIDDLNRLYAALHPDKVSKGFKLFREENHKTSGPDDYMPVFLNEKKRYAVMVVSTAAWWNTETLTGLKDPAKPIEAGTTDLLDFFEDAMAYWSLSVQSYLYKYQSSQALHAPTSPHERLRKQAFVRAFPGGHNDCFGARSPTKEDLGVGETKYNWPWISFMNRRFEGVLNGTSSSQVLKRAATGPDFFKDVHYLDLDRPARLRPDGHLSWDCLHYAVGTGVKEGWTAYIHYFFTNLARRGLLELVSAHDAIAQDMKAVGTKEGFSLPEEQRCAQCLQGLI